MSDPIANKQKWAAKNAGKTLHPEDVARQAQAREKVPPGQTVAKGWPRLDLGLVPTVPKERWSLKIGGLVERPVTLTFEQFMALPQSEQTADMHCVTHWSVLDSRFSGVAFTALAAHAGVKPEATHVYFKCYDGYTTNLDLECCMDADVMVIHAWNGRPLDAEHGGPVRMLVPKRYLWKSAKWIHEIEFLSADRPGFWEIRGYHNHACPWTEERFS
jgi:DMSO/TMAO reductase YedYZ molybdopterin-dependent catalytic subunit